MFIENKKSWLDLLLNNINISYFSSFVHQWCLSKLTKLSPFEKYYLYTITIFATK